MAGFPARSASSSSLAAAFILRNNSCTLNLIRRYHSMQNPNSATYIRAQRDLVILQLDSAAL